MYTIADFWNIKLKSVPPAAIVNLPGWESKLSPNATFIEPPVSLASGFGSNRPEEANIILISAPGAVGKSTLAREICASTHSMLIDLSRTRPVGGNFLYGGLARLGLANPTHDSRAAIVIDALDEARMRVTQEAYGAFIDDVLDYASATSTSIVLLGRTGAIQEAWLFFSEAGVEVPVLEIGFHPPGQAEMFVQRQIEYLRGVEEAQEADILAARRILHDLRLNTHLDGGTFSGYAPVLIAIAKQVCAYGNPSELLSNLESGGESTTLISVIESILLRDQTKLDPLIFEDASLKQTLYSPREQVERLANLIYGFAGEPTLPKMSDADRETYNNALDQWVKEHPFLDGAGSRPSSAVFSGLIAAHALKHQATRSRVLSSEFGKGTAVNPFISEFLLPQMQTPIHLDKIDLDMGVVGLGFASLRAQLTQGGYANMLIEEIEADGTSDKPVCYTEINFRRRNGEPVKEIRYEFSKILPISMGSSIEHTQIFGKSIEVMFSSSAELNIMAPVDLDVGTLIVGSERVVVEASDHTLSKGEQDNERVRAFLSAEHCESSRVNSRPILRGRVTLEVDWPGSEAFPWTDFTSSREVPANPQVWEAMQKLKRMIRLFRRHGRPQLGKTRASIDHERRMQGSGRLVRDALLRERVFTIDGHQYYLDPDRLRDVVGMSFLDAIGTSYSPKMVDFLESAIKHR